ncbi:MAG: ROK family protein [Chloroflexi bacterium]|nr:ROK family protein [Chloroflexota bacterium]
MGQRIDPILLALDFGGTKLSAATARPGERRWLALERSKSPSIKDARYEYATMLTLAGRVLGGCAPAATGVSFGGPVDAGRGRVILSHHVSGWDDTPLRDRLESELHAPASVDNDANVACLGEYAYGAGQGCSSLLYVTVSTGVGGGWVLDGQVYHGANGMASEIGHTIVDPAGPVCICGRRGCVEVMAGGPAIAREARAQILAQPASGSKLRARVNGELGALTAEIVAHAANAGDPLARAVVDSAARALGFGIGTAITLMNPERVVVGGGVSKSGERYWSELRAAARANTLPQMQVDLAPALLGDDAPLWGAIVLAERQLSG